MRTYEKLHNIWLFILDYLLIHTYMLVTIVKIYTYYICKRTYMYIYLFLPSTVG